MPFRVQAPSVEGTSAAAVTGALSSGPVKGP